MLTRRLQAISIEYMNTVAPWLNPRFVRLCIALLEFHVVRGLLVRGGDQRHRVNVSVAKGGVQSGLSTVVSRLVARANTPYTPSGAGAGSSGALRLVHTLWYGDVDRETAFVVKSALATSRSPDDMRFILWVDGPDYDRQQAQPGYYWQQLQTCSPFVELRRWDGFAEALSLVDSWRWDVRDHVKNVFQSLNADACGKERRRAHLADLARDVILPRYGGLWVDTDTMFLKEISGLFRGKEFLGYYYYFDQDDNGDNTNDAKRMKVMNNAVMRVEANSAIGREVFNRTFLREQTFGPCDFSTMSFGVAQPPGARVLPRTDFEMPETRFAGSLRVGCRFYETVTPLERPFYELPEWTGIDKQVLVHTHNECPRNVSTGGRHIEEGSPFAFFEGLYHDVLRHRHMCAI